MRKFWIYCFIKGAKLTDTNHKTRTFLVGDMVYLTRSQKHDSDGREIILLVDGQHRIYRWNVNQGKDFLEYYSSIVHKDNINHLRNITVGL